MWHCPVCNDLLSDTIGVCPKKHYNQMITPDQQIVAKIKSAAEKENRPLTTAETLIVAIMEQK